MELTKETAKLVCNLEFLIGECCENNNSYNAYTDEYGCVFRYPVWVLRTDIVEENGCEKEVDNSFKTSLNLADLSNVVSIDDVRNIFYKFSTKPKGEYNERDKILSYQRSPLFCNRIRLQG